MVLKECYRILKKSGRIIFTVILPSSMKIINDIFINTLDELNIKDVKKKYNEILFMQRKDIDYYNKVLLELSYKVINIKIENFTMEFIDGISFINYYLFRMMFRYQWLNLVEKDKQSLLMKKIRGKYELICR